MPYNYQPLDRTRRQIRLVTLLPGQQGSPIRCTLHIADLDAKLRYEALSYEWGAANPTREIELDGQPFALRENLWWALYHVRHTTRCRVMWIDAICIDQTSLLERNHQVRMMGDVYSHATQVRSWLGYAEWWVPEVSATFKLLRRSRLWYKKWNLPHIAIRFDFPRRSRVNCYEWLYPPPGNCYRFLPRVGDSVDIDQIDYCIDYCTSQTQRN